MQSDHLPLRISRSGHSISRRNIDPDAIKVLYRLYRAGHTAYLVGGGVRDLLLGRSPKDFDIVTSARPAQAKRLFRNCRLIGRRFRLAHLHYPSGKLIELSTFRANPGSDEPGGDDEDLLVVSDNRFGTPRQDAERRDFTINSLFYDISGFLLIDYVGGLADIQAGLVRTIGDPKQRFQEDPVRMIRAIKFSARLGFTIEASSWEAIQLLAPLVGRSAPSRVKEELARLLDEGSAERSLELLDESGLLEWMDFGLEAYLRIAARGGLDFDSDGRLVFRLLRRCDAERGRAKVGRNLLFCCWVLPLLLRDGILEESEDWLDSLNDGLARLGVMRRDSESVLDTLLLFRRLALRRKRKRGQGRPLEEREAFGDALKLLEFLAVELPELAKEFDYWKDRAKPTPAPARREASRSEVPRHEGAAGKNKPKPRRLRRRSPKEVADG